MIPTKASKMFLGNVNKALSDLLKRLPDVAYSRLIIKVLRLQYNNSRSIGLYLSLN